MARTAQTHPKFEEHEARIQAAKDHLKAKRKAFLEGEAQRWAVESAPAQAALTAAVQDFHAEGANVTTICRAYGTSDRATILRMLPAPGMPRLPVHEPDPEHPYEVTNTDPKAFTVTETATGHALVFDVQVAPARIIRADRDSQALKTEVKTDPTHPIRALLPVDMKS
jgi:hypothetical protein